MITKLGKLTSSQINHISPIETVSSQLLPYEPRYDRYKPALLLAQFPANLSGVISMLDADSSRFPRKKIDLNVIRFNFQEVVSGSDQTDIK